MDTRNLITIDPEILGGVPVFKGTRVPIKTLFEYLENDYSLEEFLECFPSVTRNLARQVLECSGQALTPSTAAWGFCLTSVVPGPMHKLLIGQSCSTVQDLGWGGIKNGDLLQRAEGEFDLFITSDQNIRYQQNLIGRRIAILELSTNDISRIQAAVRPLSRSRWFDVRWICSSALRRPWRHSRLETSSFQWPGFKGGLQIYLLQCERFSTSSCQSTHMAKTPSQL
jgi:uncharacterized protein (DUF433 family)